MKTIKKDSLWANYHFETGYTFTEIKFMVSLEFENQENRRVDFSQGDTTFTTRHSIRDKF
jgi:hypothetical protein